MGDEGYGAGGGAGADVCRKIFVGGLHWNTTTEGLKAYFEQFGQVLECIIMRDPTGRSRCFGFVTFADAAVLDALLQKTHILDKKQIDPKRAIPKDQQHPSAPASAAAVTPMLLGGRSAAGAPPKDEDKVFVGGIHIEADERDLRETFGEFGEVLETILMRDRETGRSRGFGFVTFAGPDGAHRACTNTEIRIRGRRVEVKMAVPKGKTSAGAAGAAPHGEQGDAYAAWAEYFKAYPEYYEAMVKAYNDPATMAAYYNQYYGSTYANGAAVDPSQYAAFAAAAAAESGGYSEYAAAAAAAADPQEPFSPSRERNGGDSYRPEEGGAPRAPGREKDRGADRDRGRPGRGRPDDRERDRGADRGRDRGRDERRPRRQSGGGSPPGARGPALQYAAAPRGPADAPAVPPGMPPIMPAHSGDRYRPEHGAAHPSRSARSHHPYAR